MLQLGRAFIPGAESMLSAADAARIMRENRIIGAEVRQNGFMTAPGDGFVLGTYGVFPSVRIASMPPTRFTISERLRNFRNCA